ncbi:hypothetical protein E4U43_000734 [Claviceps pusilla]|uniref:Fringe-like glycosyltransferase domain-containing protein n=1 Tax=Claviceps pusilla TaxID=123648 RepID=A0A9P7N8X3_9HYPO|nr:hypothetical protein E4U43_000734 [Claviceps pusilla]
MALRRSRSKRAIAIAIYISVFVAFVLYIRTNSRLSSASRLLGTQSSAKVSNPVAGDDATCRASDARLVDLQKRYSLQTSFQYLRRAIHLTRNPSVQRSKLTKLSQPMLKKDFQLVQLQPRLENVVSSCDEPIEVHVSASDFPQTVNASELIFGVSTTFERFSASAAVLINDWSFWLTDGYRHPNGGKLVLMLLDASPAQLHQVKSTLSEAGIDADTYASDASLPMSARNMALIPTMYAHPEAGKKKWFVLCDDDTFFPNMHALMAVLAKHDETKGMYIGALSEDSGATAKHGLQAFGGAGIFLSRATAKVVSNNFEECSSEDKIEQADQQGDRLLRQCIEEHSGIELTPLHDLWQLDIFDDPSGFYEWGIKPLSLHHYRSWHQSRPGDLTKLAYICGEDCTLQRFQTVDNFVISGFSIAHYPSGIDFDTNQVERTFRSENGTDDAFDDKMGHQRPSLSQTGKKIAWTLKECVWQQDGSLLQTYVREANDTRWSDAHGKPMSKHDGIIELVWTTGR